MLDTFYFTELVSWSFFTAQLFCLMFIGLFKAMHWVQELPFLFQSFLVLTVFKEYSRMTSVWRNGQPERSLKIKYFCNILLFSIEPSSYRRYIVFKLKSNNPESLKGLISIFERRHWLKNLERDKQYSFLSKVYLLDIWEIGVWGFQWFFRLPVAL